MRVSSVGLPLSFAGGQSLPPVFPSVCEGTMPAGNIEQSAVVDGVVERSAAILVLVVSGAVKSLHPN